MVTHIHESEQANKVLQPYGYVVRDTVSAKNGCCLPYLYLAPCPCILLSGQRRISFRAPGPNSTHISKDGDIDYRDLTITRSLTKRDMGKLGVGARVARSSCAAKQRV